jgi:hypothetical protein
MRRIEWHDDFLGQKLRPEYSMVPGTAGPSHGPVNIGGAWWELRTTTPQNHSGRIRLGDDPTDTGGTALAMPFLHAALARGRTRVCLDANLHMNATIGFVGPDDPNGVGGSILYRYQFGYQGWKLQTVKLGVSTNTALVNAAGMQFNHTPGVPFEVDIFLSPKAVVATVFAPGGPYMAANTTNIPDGGAAWEYQIWGHEQNAGQGDWATPTMKFDYLNISQDRL